MAKKFPWYKRYPSNAIAGKIGLNPEQKGVYDTLIDLAYDKNGPVPDDDVELARLCGCSRRLYRSIRDQLIAKEKIWIDQDGRIMVRGFRRGSDEFRPEFEPSSDDKSDAKTARKSAESGAKSGAHGGKSNTSGGITPSRARAQGQSPEARSQNPAGLKYKNQPNPDALAIALCREMGEEFDPTSDRGNWPSLIARMIDEDGLNFETDILPAVRARVQRGISVHVRTPLFFRQDAQRIAQGRATRVSTTPQEAEVSTTPQAWAAKLTRFLECGFWAGPGPSPIHVACMAPPAQLARARQTWAAQGNHPLYADAECNFPWRPKAGSRGMGSDLFPEAIPLEAIPEKGAQH